MNTRHVLCLMFGWSALCGFCLGGGADQAGAAPARPGETTLLLSEKHGWRKHYTFRRPEFAGQGEVKSPANVPGSVPVADSVYSLFAAAPPREWTRPDFDDGGWLLARGREFDYRLADKALAEKQSPEQSNAFLRGTDPFFVPVGLVCQRSRFLVKDRSRVRKLTLALTYRGGFVAYLNGQEVARGHLPAGEVAPDTPAEVYPAEAFFYKDSLAKGRPTPLDARDAGSKQWALRERSFGPAELPTAALRDGPNVLAIELHRATYPAECRRQGTPCATVGLSLLELRAEEEDGAFSAVEARPQVWTVDVARALVDPAWGARNEQLTPIRIVAARNGTFSGQAIVAGDCDASGNPKPLDGLAASVSDLRHTDGKGTIPKAALRIRYAVPNPLWPSAMGQLGMVVPVRWKVDAGMAGGTRLDVLLDAPPAGVSLAGVWISAKTPKNAPSGEYAGELAVALKDAPPTKIPLQLHLADWTLPDVRDQASLINVYQSPDTLAAYYKVAPWSEAHWKLIEKSMELLGGIGNIGLFIPLLAESQMGNAESMVAWIKQADGTYQYDFRVFDRYLDTALKHHDRLRFVSLNVWGYEAALKTWRGPRDYATFYGARVTVVDPATGGSAGASPSPANQAKQSFKLPRYGTPECEALWRPLLLACRERLKGKGLDGQILLGLAADLGPEPATTAMFRRILPEAGWIAESHILSRGYLYDSATKATVPVRYNSIVYGGDVPDPAARRLYGWQHDKDVLVMNFNRSGSNLLLMGFPPPWSFRTWMEATMACGRNGNGRVGGDYWHIGATLLGDGERGWGIVGGSGGTMFGRYTHSHADESGLGRSCTDLFAPGPDGSVSTVRLENAREGTQEAEARIFIEKALLNRQRPLPPELAKKCQQLLDERTHVTRLWKLGAPTLGAQGWQDRSQRLYDAAAEVAKDRMR